MMQHGLTDINAPDLKTALGDAFNSVNSYILFLNLGDFLL
jgi:hypothetical protein